MSSLGAVVTVWQLSMAALYSTCSGLSAASKFTWCYCFYWEGSSPQFQTRHEDTVSSMSKFHCILNKTAIHYMHKSVWQIFQAANTNGNRSNTMHRLNLCYLTQTAEIRHFFHFSVYLEFCYIKPQYHGKHYETSYWGTVSFRGQKADNQLGITVSYRSFH